MIARIAIVLFELIVITHSVENCYAQHPIDVQRSAADGEYFKALVNYERLPRRRATTLSIVAAARSAWGLGLSTKAILEYDKALLDEKLEPVERARLLLSRSIIEFQEERYQVAQLYAEKAAAILSAPSSLRSKVWFVWGQSLDRLAMYGAAIEQYKKAIAEATEEEQGQIYYLLGMCQARLGKSEEARDSLQKVPLRHEDAPYAIRQLAELSLNAGQVKEVEFWLTTGRREYPESFLDSWIDYALARVAILNNDQTKLSEIVDEVNKKYPPSDHWLNLLKAAIEAYRWKNNLNLKEQK